MTGTLIHQIKTLVDLQKIDAQIYVLKGKLVGFPESKKSLETAFGAKKTGLKNAQDELTALQLKQKTLEKEILSKDDQVKKFTEQQVKVKTNQEYKALTHEIESAIADKSMIEDKVIGAMDEVEAHKKRVTEETGKLAEEEKKHKVRMAEFDQNEGQLKKQVEELTAQRKQYLSSVDPELLGQYERILTKRGGTAVVPLVNDSNCGGCSLNFPPQVVNEIKMKEQVIYCESCSRIVYEL